MRLLPICFLSPPFIISDLDLQSANSPEAFLLFSGQKHGENIYPKEVEDFLYSCPAIKDVQVVGVPSQKYGEQPGAFIVKHPGFEDTTEQDIIDFCRNKIAWYKTPKYVAFVDDFPMNAAGKILKYELREMAHKLWPDA